MSFIVPMLIGFGPMTTCTIAETRVIVENGNLRHGITEGEPWVRKDGWLECRGRDNYLFADRGLGAGDATVRIRMVLLDPARSAASIMLNRGHFGFDGADPGMFVSGGLFGHFKHIGTLDDFVTPGKPFDLLLTRRNGILAFSINGRTVYSQPDSRTLFGTIGLRPWRATMRIAEFTIEGVLTPPRIRMGSVPFPIPTLDISRESSRWVVIARGTAEQYWGHPTTLLMPDGKTMFCVYPRGHGKPDAVLRRSDDAGLTWTDPIPTPANWRESNNCPALYRFVGPDDVERLFVFEGNGRMRQAMSTDSGSTWSPMHENGLRTIMPFTGIIELKDGRLMGGWNARGGTFLSFSSDGGLTWTPQILVAGETERYPDAYPCEPAFIRSPDGKQIAMVMRENSRLYNSMIMLTDDEGKTWSEMRELPRTLTGDRHQPRYAPDGRLVIPFRDMAPQTPDGGDFVAWVGTYEDLVTGKPGQYRIKLLHSYAGTDHGYSGNEVLPDGTFVITTYIKLRPGPEKQSVVSVRFTLAEMDRKFAALGTAGSPRRLAPAAR